jgi:hypothetical protein
MEPSKYLKRFQSLESEAPKAFVLTGEHLICEVIKPDEFSKKVTRDDGTQSKIILAQSPKKQVDTILGDAPMWLRVLVCGNGYYQQVTDPDSGKITEETVPLDALPGDIILVPSISVRKFSIFGHMEGYEPDSICLTKASEIQLRFRGEEGYAEAFRVLNSGPQAPVV